MHLISNTSLLLTVSIPMVAIRVYIGFHTLLLHLDFFVISCFVIHLRLFLGLFFFFLINLINETLEFKEAILSLHRDCMHFMCLYRSQYYDQYISKMLIWVTFKTVYCSRGSALLNKICQAWRSFDCRCAQHTAAPTGLFVTVSAFYKKRKCDFWVMEKTLLAQLLSHCVLSKRLKPTDGGILYITKLWKVTPFFFLTLIVLFFYFILF